MSYYNYIKFVCFKHFMKWRCIFIKSERQNEILSLLEKNNVMKVSDFVDELNVTDMTIRRDLQELEDQNLLIRIHGGARKLDNGSIPFLELSHIEKRDIHPNEKNIIAQLIAEHINNHDTVFLGSGSTIELVYNYLTINYAKIITNSIHVFNQFKYDDRFELILTGGTYRSKTGSFAGTIANDFMKTIHVGKAFIGVNAINENRVFNANEDEGVIQRIVLNNSREKYLVADHHKLEHLDFYQFYDLKDANYLVTDNKLSSELKKKYSNWIQIIN